ncbi:MAG TPA: phosphatase PAP2 family protein [Candidatus Acidoferrales bacterium]|nr:phosphatase PAP2 family protein [Candidatus Acidoferrales bacterium]
MTSKRSRPAWEKRKIASKTSSQPARSVRLRRLLVAAILAYLYVELGKLAALAPPSNLDLAFRSWMGKATPLAIVFTESGLLPALAGIAVVALLAGWKFPQWRSRAVFAVVLNLVAWKVSDVCKDVFHRARPEQWVWHRETSFSFSSGHATDAVVVYGLWAYFLWRSTLPQPWRSGISLLLALWALGVSWSRLALGVHYATDVIGGWLLAGALMMLALAVYDPVPRAAPA